MTTTNAGEIRQLPSGEYQFEPWAGVRISRACDAAAAWATEHGQQVLMQFNGICCVATPGACQLACEANLADPACGLEAGAAFACRVEEGFACDIGLPADCASLEQSLAECLARASN